MKGKRKSIISMALATIMIMSFSTVAFAGNESTVSKTQDNITVTKSANWASIEGKTQDEKGNPYVQINFKVDTTKADTEVINVISKGGSTDIVLVIDKSGSMYTNKKLDKAKVAACDFVDSILAIPTNEVKVGVVSFGSYEKKEVDLTSDKTSIKTAINNLNTGGSTMMCKGIKEAQAMLATSKADNKMMVVLGDGYPTRSEDTKKEAEVAKQAGTKIITIGYDCNVSLLKEVASKGENGKELYYEAAVNATSLLNDLGDAFVQITENVTSTIVGNSLVDIIPAEFTIVDGTVKCNDSKCASIVAEDKKSVTWNWGKEKLEKKVYEMSLVTTLDMTKVPAEYITEKADIYTNGTTIKTDVNSEGSSYFGYGGANIIKLTSPKLSLGDMEKVVEVEDEDDKKLSAEGVDPELDKSPSTGDEFNLIAIVVLASSGIVLVGTGNAIKRRNSYR